MMIEWMHERNVVSTVVRRRSSSAQNIRHPLNKCGWFALASIGFSTRISWSFRCTRTTEWRKFFATFPRDWCRGDEKRIKRHNSRLIVLLGFWTRVTLGWHIHKNPLTERYLKYLVFVFEKCPTIHAPNIIAKMQALLGWRRGRDDGISGKPLLVLNSITICKCNDHHNVASKWNLNSTIAITNNGEKLSTIPCEQWRKLHSNRYLKRLSHGTSPVKRCHWI